MGAYCFTRQGIQFFTYLLEMTVDKEYKVVKTKTKSVLHILAFLKRKYERRQVCTAARQ